MNKTVKIILLSIGGLILLFILRVLFAGGSTEYLVEFVKPDNYKEVIDNSVEPSTLEPLEKEIETPEIETNTTPEDGSKLTPSLMLGTWEGQLLGKDFKLVLNFAQDGKVSGYNVCGNNERPVSGTYEQAGLAASCEDGYWVKLNEPGDKKGDGVFDLTLMMSLDYTETDYGPECSGSYKPYSGVGNWSSFTSSKEHSIHLEYK